MISKTVMSLKDRIAEEFNKQKFSQKKFWEQSFEELIGHRILVLWVNPRSVAKSAVVTVVRKYKHFAVVHERIVDSEGVERDPLVLTIHYCDLIGKTAYIELLEESL